MFQYLSIPPAEGGSVLESAEVSTTAPTSLPPQTHQGPSQSSQPLPFPIPAIAMSFVQPETQQYSSTKLESTITNPSIGALLQQAHDDNQQSISGHAETHLQGQELLPGRSLPQAPAQSHLQPLSFSNANSHSLPLPLPLPHPQLGHHLHVPPQQLFNSHPQLQSPQTAAVSSLLHSPSYPIASRQKSHLSGEPILYSTPNIASSEAFSNPLLPPPLPVDERGQHPFAKRSRSVRKAPYTSPSDLPQRSPRKRQKRSFVWNFFRESDSDPNTALCLICQLQIPRGRNLARNTTNLRKHLEHRHADHLSNQQHMMHFRPKRELNPVPTLQPVSRRSEYQGQAHGASGSLNMSLVASTSQCPQTPLESSSVLLPSHSQYTFQPRASVTMPTSSAVQTPYNATVPDFQNERNMRQPLHDSSLGLSLHSSKVELGPSMNGQASAQKNIQEPRMHTNGHLLTLNRNNEGPKLKEPSHARSDLSPLRSQKALRTEMENVNGALPALATASTDTQQVSNGLLNCLAVLELPVAASKSKGFASLFDAANLNVSFPSVSKMRSSIMPTRVKALKTKVQGCLSHADSVVVGVETMNANKVIFCQYYESGLDFRTVCIDVLPRQNHLREAMDCARVTTVKPSPHLATLGEARRVEDRKTSYCVLDEVRKVIEDWNIAEKVKAVVVSESSLPRDKPVFLYKKNRVKLEEIMQTDREAVGSLPRKYAMSTACEDGTKEVLDQYINRSIPNNLKKSRIPVLSCLIKVLEQIVDETICGNVSILQQFIEPMSLGIFKAWTDSDFLCNEDKSIRPTPFELPLVNLNRVRLDKVLVYFTAHLDMIKAVLRKQGEVTDIIKIRSTDLLLLQELLGPFSESIAHIRKNQMSVFSCEKVSVALPVLKLLTTRVEEIHDKAPDSLRTVVADVLTAVRRQAEHMEAQEIYACATLLDPRFKGTPFSSRKAAEAAESWLTDACEVERHRLEEMQTERPSGANVSNSCGAGLVTQFVDSFVVDRNALETTSSSIAQYLIEPTEEYMQDVDQYWRKHRKKWPVLTKLATQYALIPCSCETNRTSSVLGDYRHVEKSDEDSQDAVNLTFLRTNLLLADRCCALPEG